VPTSPPDVVEIADSNSPPALQRGHPQTSPSAETAGTATAAPGVAAELHDATAAPAAATAAATAPTGARPVFGAAAGVARGKAQTPLAERMRPRSLDEVRQPAPRLCVRAEA
jgi:hypothetical protein